MEDTNVQAENSNTAEEVVLDTTENTETTVEETEDIEAIKERAAKAEELANNYKIRAEKAEKKAKEIKPETKSATSLSTKDVFALVEAKVSEDDVTEVEEFAKFKGISISEALKTSTLKAILAEKKENRQVASATNVGTARRSSTKVSDETLSDKASKGELPESDEDLRRLVRIRKGIK